MYRIEIPQDTVMHFDPVLKAVGTRGVIAGGAARYIAYLAGHLKNPPSFPNDVDLFHTRQREPGEKAMGSSLFRLGWRTKGVTLHTCEYEHHDHSLTLQLVMPHENQYEKMYGPVRELLHQFDFTTNMFGVTYENDRFYLYYTDDAIKDTEQNRIRICHVNNPIAMCHRAATYMVKGYTIEPEQWAKILLAWEGRDAAYRQRVHEIVEGIEHGSHVGYMLLH